MVNGFRATPRGTLKLNVPVIVADEKFRRRSSAGFWSAHPGVTLKIVANDDFIDVVDAASTPASATKSGSSAT